MVRPRKNLEVQSVIEHRFVNLDPLFLQTRRMAPRFLQKRHVHFSPISHSGKHVPRFLLAVPTYYVNQCPPLYIQFLPKAGGSAPTLFVGQLEEHPIIPERHLRIGFIPPVRSVQYPARTAPRRATPRHGQAEATQDGVLAVGCFRQMRAARVDGSATSSPEYGLRR